MFKLCISLPALHQDRPMLGAEHDEQRFLPPCARMPVRMHCGGSCSCTSLRAHSERRSD